MLVPPGLISGYPFYVDIFLCAHNKITLLGIAVQLALNLIEVVMPWFGVLCLQGKNPSIIGKLLVLSTAWQSEGLCIRQGGVALGS